MKLAAERRAAILRSARLRGSVRVTEVADAMGVSTVTIRRDVNALVDEGALERVHGGATLPAGASGRTRSSGRGLRATVGLLVPSATYYYPAVIRGAEAAAAALGVRLVLAISQYYPEEDRRQVDRLIDVGVDGLLLATSTSADEGADVSEWISLLPVPTVLVERQADLRHSGRVDHVRTDHVAGARLAVQHLADLGHGRVSLATREGTPTSRWLALGHTQAVADRVIEASGEPVLLPRPNVDPKVRADALSQVLAQARRGRPHAALVHNDEDAMELARVAGARGLRVPDDLAIVAYDDEVAALSDVALTAVAPPKHDVGRQSLELLMRRLVHPRGDDSAQHVSLMPHLVVRDSCSTPAG